MRSGRKVEENSFGKGDIEKEGNKCETISREEVRIGLRRMNYGKVTGLYWIAMKFLTRGRKVMVDWLKRIFNLYMTTERGLKDWKETCIVPL